MQSLPVEFRHTATDDLLAIFHYVLDKSQRFDLATDFVTRIRRRCERIGHAPFGGRERNDLSEGLRTVPFEKTIVVAYVVKNEIVSITNIFYGGRDYEAIYRGNSDRD